jgi:hypothetical protein
MEDDAWMFWDEDWMDDDERAGVMGEGLPRDPDAEAFDSYEED